jgi:hypothetical protein
MAVVSKKLNLIIPPSAGSVAAAKSQERAIHLAKETLTSLSQEEVLSLSKVQSAFEAAMKIFNEAMSDLPLLSRLSQSNATKLLLDFQDATKQEFEHLKKCQRIRKETLIGLSPFPRELNTVHFSRETESDLWHRAIQTVAQTEAPLYKFETDSNINAAELQQLVNEVEDEFQQAPGVLEELPGVVGDLEKALVDDLMKQMIKEMLEIQAGKKKVADNGCAQNSD